MATSHPSDFNDRNAATVAGQWGAMKTKAVAAVNTGSGVIDWLISAVPGHKIVVHKIAGPVVTGQASTMVLSAYTGGATVALNTTLCGYVTAAVTVSSAWEVPLVASVQPASGIPMAIGETHKALHLHGVCTSATACIAVITYSVVPDLSEPVSI